jgi:hypothetical protein
MKPLEWISNLLEQRSIPKPDGRTLYQYRITDEEFESLKAVLHDASIAGIGRAIRANFFDMVFVLYGAEWWRRHYEGHWGWEGIFQSFSGDFQNLSTNQRNTLVESGLRRWQRKVRTTNLRRNFLGSIAIEGGLPLHQLASAGGWLQPALNQVTKRYLELGEERFEASYIASQYAQYMPKTFQREEVYEILGDMIAAVAVLKSSYDLHEKEDPIDWLNTNQPDWKSEFPLPLDDAVGNAILADLVRTAISTKQGVQIDVFAGTRYLTGVSIGDPRLCFQLQCQPFCQLRDLLTPEASEQIPHRLQLELFNAEGKTWRFADAYRVQWKGLPALKINNQQRVLQGEETIEGIRLRFRHLGDSYGELDIGVDGLDQEVPWVFVEKGDRWQFVGQASQKLSVGEAVVWVPNTLYFTLADRESASIGRFGGGEFFKIDRDLGLDNGEDNYLIRVNQEEDTAVEYMLSGKRLAVTSQPAELFVGKPRLMVLNKITGQRNAVQDHRVRTRPIGAREGWRTLTDTLPGLHELQVVDGNTIMYRKRIGIFPDNTSIDLVPGNSPNQGSIRLNRLGGWKVDCKGLDVMGLDVKAVYSEGDMDRRIGLSTKHSPPAVLDVDIWRDNALHPIKLKLPYPAQGVVLVDPVGALASTSAELFTDALHGYRLRFFSQRPSRSLISIRLALIDAELSDTKDLYIEIQKSLNDGSVELPLIDFVSDIRALLAISKNLDAFVKFSLYNEGAELAALKFRRFKMNLEPVRPTGEVQLKTSSISEVSIDELVGLELHATRLSQPEQASIKLDATSSQGMSMGIWQFSPGLRSAGPWLIYSSDSSETLARPLLWNVPGHTSPEHIRTLHAAVCIDDPELRAETFRAIFKEMANDRGHSGWEYLRTLWRRFQHLPLSTFQVWKEAVLNSALLAAMAIHLDVEILVRVEEELPVMWELIPVAVWLDVLSADQTNLKMSLGDDALVRSIIGDSVDRISGLNDVMATVARIVRQRLLNETDGELRIMQLPTAGDMTMSFLVKPHQAILQRQADSQWPEFLKGEVQYAWDELPSELSRLMPDDQFHRATVVHLPFVLVHKLFSDAAEMSDPIHVFKYRRLKQFDEDWYSASFNYACGFWSQQIEDI